MRDEHTVRCRYCDTAFTTNQFSNNELKKIAEDNAIKLNLYQYQCPVCGNTTQAYAFPFDTETDMEILYRQALRHIQKLNKDIKVDTVDLKKAIEESEKLTGKEK